MTTEPRALGRPYDAALDQPLPDMPAIPSPAEVPLAERMAAADAQSTEPASADDQAADPDDDEGGKGKKGPSQEQKLRDLARREFVTYRAPDGRMYGSHRNNPGRALRHGKPSELMKAVCLRYVDIFNAWPNSTSQAAVTGYLEAVTDEHRAVPVRCHWDRKRLLLDVADQAGTVLVLDGKGVRPAQDRPVTFRKPAASAPLPWPLPASGDLDMLWKLVRVVEADRPVVLALLVMSWLTGLPQPVVLVTGPADAGKTTTARFLLSLVDPATHQRGGSLPQEEDQWKARVGQGRVVFIDNSGHITVKTSDLMCRVATGGELTTRELFTNDGAHVSDLLVPIWLTSIDSGVLRGDLQSRIVPIELRAIDETDRAVLSDLENAQDDARPGITRALVDLADKVIGMLPTVDRGRLVHRMTDFNLVLRCIDRILSTDGEQRLVGQAAELAGDVLEADPIASALLTLLSNTDTEWIGENNAVGQIIDGVTADKLLRILTAVTPLDRRGKDWPVTPRVLSSRLRQIQPALLQAHDVRLELRKSNGVKRWTATRPPAAEPEPVEPEQVAPAEPEAPHLF